MIWLSAVLGGLGLICLLSKKSLLGILVGIQICFLGATLSFLGGEDGGAARFQGTSFGLLIALSSLALVTTGYALAVRLFYLRKSASLDQTRSLRN